MNPKKIPQLESAVVGNEILVHDVRNGKVHVLNVVAGRILELCDGQLAPADIAGYVSREYGAAPDVAERDVASILETFASLHLLETAV